MFGIPQDKLPDCLKDEQRLNVLFAPLRHRSVNPKDWESKISSWKSILKIYCETNEVYSFTLSQLNRVFVRHGRPPDCLKELIKDMLQSGELQTLDIYMRKNNKSWSSWAVDNLVYYPLSWSFNKVKNRVFTPTETDQECVHLDIVKTKCKSILDSVPDKFRNKLISVRELLYLLDKDISQLSNVKLLLNYLENNQKVGIMTLDKYKDELDKLLIKFGDSKSPVVITEIDIGTYMLEQSEKSIQKDIETLEENIENCLEEAKKQLSKKHKQLAKNALRKKHELEKKGDKKLSALHNIQILIERIHDNHSDVQVWEAYKTALNALNSSFKDTGLSETSVEDTMIKLSDVLEEHNDIQQALARSPCDTYNDSDLEEELAELLNDESTNQPPPDGGEVKQLGEEMEKMSLNLPQVPDSSPDVSSNDLSPVKL